MPRPNTIQSVDRALDILEALGAAPDGTGLSELARALELKTPTTHNLLRTLTARGYASQDEGTQKYRLGAACAVLGRLCQRGLRVPQVAQPPLRALSAELNESAVLGMRERGEVAFVARVETSRMLTVNFGQVWVPDAYSSVCGRVLLAYLLPEALAAYLATHPLAASKATDLRSKKALIGALEAIRAQGYCAYWRQNDTVFAVAARVFDADGNAVAAVGVPIPGVRVFAETEPRIVEAVCRTAEEISRALGWRDGVDSVDSVP